MLGMSLKNRLILILDDDPLVGLILEKALEVKSKTFATGRELLEHESTFPPLAVFVDLNLGDGQLGSEFIPDVRRKYPLTPIIVVTANESEDALSESFARGADDFVRKPISDREIVARLQRRLTELAKREASTSLRLADVVLNKEFRQIRGQKKQVELSPIAFRVLEVLSEANGLVVTRQVLKRKAWDASAVSDNALDRKIHEARKAIQTTSRLLSVRAIYGSGFVLEVKKESP